VAQTSAIERELLALDQDMIRCLDPGQLPGWLGPGSAGDEQHSQQ
jgi:hypothetical protein